jgi:TonB family protein
MMRTLRKNNKVCLVSSIIMHVIVVLTALSYASTPSKKIMPGDSMHDAIDAYVYQNVSTPTISHTETPDKKMGIALNKMKTPLTLDHAPSTHQSRAAIKGEKSAGLLALLHNAIQSQQHYPESALEMEREGRVTLSFILLTNGQIKQLAIAHTSGTASLDQAALAAIQAAAPFSGIDKYIHQDGEYSIDVVFQLS